MDDRCSGLAISRNDCKDCVDELDDSLESRGEERCGKSRSRLSGLSGKSQTG